MDVSIGPGVVAMISNTVGQIVWQSADGTWQRVRTTLAWLPTPGIGPGLSRFFIHHVPMTSLKSVKFPVQTAITFKLLLYSQNSSRQSNLNADKSPGGAAILRLLDPTRLCADHGVPVIRCGNLKALAGSMIARTGMALGDLCGLGFWITL